MSNTHKAPIMHTQNNFIIRIFHEIHITHIPMRMRFNMIRLWNLHFKKRIPINNHFFLFANTISIITRDKAKNNDEEK